MVHAWDLGCRI